MGFDEGFIENLFRGISSGRVLFGADSESFIEDLDDSGRKIRITVSESLPSEGILINKFSERQRNFLIFDFSGRNDVYFSLEDELEFDDMGSIYNTGRKVLVIRDKRKVLIQPFIVGVRKQSQIKSEFNNGILEVILKK